MNFRTPLLYSSSDDPTLVQMLLSLQTSNTAPVDAELLRLTTFRTASTEALHDLKEEQRALEETIIKASQRLAKVRSDLAKRSSQLSVCSKVLSPIRRIPPEILAEIFLHTARKYPMASSSSTPMVLARVSLSWRQTALALPQLWDSLCVDYNPTGTYALAPSSNTPGRKEPPSHFMRVWFQRAQILPLSLSLTISRDQFGVTETIRPFLLETILAYSHRIRELDIEATVKPVLDPLFRLEGERFSSLESLTLRVGQVGPWPNSITAFKGSPRLRSLFLDMRPMNPFRIDVNWAQLTHLDLLASQQPLHRTAWKHLIRLCTNVETGSFFLSSMPRLMFDAMPFSIVSADPTNPVTFRRLIELKLKTQGPDTLASLIYGLFFPKLKHLEVRAEAGHRYFNERLKLHPDAHLELQLQNLTSLNISMVMITAADLISLLSNLFLLERLSLNIDASDFNFESLASHLTLKNDPMSVEEVAFLPRFHQLSIWLYKLDRILSQAYAAMLHSRFKFHQRMVQGGGGVTSKLDRFLVGVYLDKNKATVLEGIPILLEECGQGWDEYLRVHVVPPYTRI